MLWHFVIWARVGGRVPVQRHPARDDQICPIFSCLAALTSHDECPPHERERETNRACCCWCSQLMTTHHATEGFARRRSAHRRVSTNSGIALKTWGPAYCDFWSLFKLIKWKKTQKTLHRTAADASTFSPLFILQFSVPEFHLLQWVKS